MLYSFVKNNNNFTRLIDSFLIDDESQDRVIDHRPLASLATKKYSKYTLPSIVFNRMGKGIICEEP